MSYKDINEKYKKILQEDFEKRRIEEEKEMNEAVVSNAKIAFNEYKKLRKNIDKLITSLQIELKNHQNRFFQGKYPEMGYISDLEQLRVDLEKTISMLKAPDIMKLRY